MKTIKSFFVVCLVAFLLSVPCGAVTKLHEIPLEEWQGTVRQLVDKLRAEEIDTIVKAWAGALYQMPNADFIKMAENPTVALALTQQEVVSRLGPNALRTVDREGGREFLQKLFASEEMMGMLVYSGTVPKDLSEVIQIWAKIWKEDADVRKGISDKNISNKNISDEGKMPSLLDGLWLRVAAAVAMEFGGGSPPGNRYPLNKKDGKLDPMVRYKFLKESQMAGRLFVNFETMPVWELRFVAGTPLSEREMLWAQEKATEHEVDRKNPGSIGRCFGLVPYRMYSLKGVSVHAGGKYYDNKPVTMQLLTEYGGVCGAISTFGSLMCLANGIPAQTMGQPPDHCAFCWKPGASWLIGNDVHGWYVSNIYGSKIPWGGSGMQLLLMQEVYGKFLPQYMMDRRVMRLYELRGKKDGLREFSLAALEKSPMDYGVWRDLAGDISKVKIIDGNEDGTFGAMVGKAIGALANYPPLFAEWLGICGKGLKKGFGADVQEDFDRYFAELVTRSVAEAGKETAALGILVVYAKQRMAEEGAGGAKDLFYAQAVERFYDSLPRNRRARVRNILASMQAGCEAGGNKAATDFFRVFSEFKKQVIKKAEERKKSEQEAKGKPEAPKPKKESKLKKSQHDKDKAETA